MEVLCRDRVDGDGDGLVDCDDPDCAELRDCRELSCTDEADHDRDGLTDCEDPECIGTLACPELDCADGLDDEGDGLADCADPRCAGTEACPIAAEVECADELDDDEDGLVDCADPDCALSCPHESCADGDLGSALGLPVFQGTLIDRPDTWEPGDCTALGTGEDAPDLALLWTAPEAGAYIVSTLGSEADTVLTSYPADCERRELGCSDDRPSVTSSAIRLELEAGEQRVLVISSYQEEDAEAVRLHIYRAPEAP